MKTPSNLTVIVPLFPRHPGLPHALATLRAQTVRPDLIVLIDDGETADAEATTKEVPGVPVKVVKADTPDVAAAINRAVDVLDHSTYIAVLGAGGAYAPQRLERCRAAIDDPSRFRQPGLVVTGIVPVGRQGIPLPADDQRHSQLTRLWAPGREGVGIPEWLGAGDFVLAAANIFARRSFLRANPLVTGVPSYAYHAAIQAGVQGQLEILDEPLLEYHWSGPESVHSTLAIAALLRAQVRLLGALREKLGTSPETRRNFAAFHRAAWKNISGLREDLFAQAALQLASLASPEETMRIVDHFAAGSDLLEVPTHLRSLREGRAFADPESYSAALAQTREELAQLKIEHMRLQRVADAAQDSGWVRFGAWLGERSARHIMEMEEEENASVQPPDGEVKSGRKNNPDKIGNKQP
jgi:glycosyltransferase involved in cell wall biosynthesis